MKNTYITAVLLVIAIVGGLFVIGSVDAIGAFVENFEIEVELGVTVVALAIALMSVMVSQRLGGQFGKAWRWIFFGSIFYAASAIEGALEELEIISIDGAGDILELGMVLCLAIGVYTLARLIRSENR